MCLALANPPKVAYRWFINDQLVLGKYSAELDLRNVSQRHHNSVIKCEAYNEIGKNEEIITLDVSCKYKNVITYKMCMYVKYIGPKM